MVDLRRIGDVSESAPSGWASSESSPRIKVSGNMLLVNKMRSLLLSQGCRFICTMALTRRRWNNPSRCAERIDLCIVRVEDGPIDSNLQALAFSF